MGFPFYHTSYNDSRLKKIKENLRKSNKKGIDLVEIMSLKTYNLVYNNNVILLLYYWIPELAGTPSPSSLRRGALDI